MSCVGLVLKFRKSEEMEPMKTTALDSGTASRTGKPADFAVNPRLQRRVAEEHRDVLPLVLCLQQPSEL